MFSDGSFGKNIREKYSVSIDNWEVKTADRSPGTQKLKVKGLVRNYVVSEVMQNYPICSLFYYLSPESKYLSFSFLYFQNIGIISRSSLDQ